MVTEKELAFTSWYTASLGSLLSSMHKMFPSHLGLFSLTVRSNIWEMI